MKATLERLEKNIVALQVEVDAAEFSKAYNQVVKKLAKQVNIAGFRKGKVPKRILESRVGKEVICDEALELVLPKAYYDAVLESAIEPVDQPKIDVVQIEEGKPLIFKATIEVKPGVELGEYRGLQAEVQTSEVTEEDVEKQLMTLQSRHAQLEAVDEGVAKAGDLVVIDFQGFKDGVPFEGGEGENYTLELGSGSFIPGFEEQVMGHSAGEEFEIQVTFPTDYHVAELAGAPAVFKVSVKEVKRKKLAPIDDEFAKDVSEFETLDELKADIRRGMEEKIKEGAESQLKDQLVTQAVANAAVEVPGVMVDRRLQTLMEDMARRVEYQGLDLESYFRVLGKTEEEYKAEMRVHAENLVKSDLVLKAIAQKEGLDVTEADLDAEIQKLSTRTMQDPEVLRAYFKDQDAMAGLKEGILIDKAIAFLIENRAQ